MFASFRARLIFGFALVIGLALFLSASGFVLLLRQEQNQAAEQRIGLLVGPISEGTRNLQQAGWPAEVIRAQLVEVADHYQFRVLMIDQQQRVILDTAKDQSLLGQVIDIPADIPADQVKNGMESFRSHRVNREGRDLYLFTQADVTGIGAAAQTKMPTRLVIAVPAADVNQSWARLLPRLALAGLGAGFAAVVFSLVLASRITTPIAQMTRASQAMARGDLEQRIDVDGSDEVGRLASAFNQMSSQISRSNHAMRDLLADVSHELKTPLTSIQGFSQALVEGVGDPREAGELIHEEAERMRILVDDLLYLGEIESGAVRMELEDVAVDELVEATEPRLRHQAEEAGVGVEARPGAGVTIRADGRRLEQVFANLVDNAVRFARPGSTVAITSKAVAGGVLVNVHNVGEPLPEDVRARVFDRFYQADTARSGRHRGLGLSIVQELVQAHGGTVAVESTAEEGTTFSVFLPTGGPTKPTSATAVR
ncbi:MAG: HAMP domain-containing histidine kinase [Dehalococcoidia bacterium]|nr:MAG: HAMP domain-containing histidine kinase [Dehalococcoidia bacterium]